MSRIHPECPDSDPSGRLVAADVLLRQEPDEEEDEGEGDGKEDDDDYHWPFGDCLRTIGNRVGLVGSEVTDDLSPDAQVKKHHGSKTRNA
jgi:hypothetical protein